MWLSFAPDAAVLLTMRKAMKRAPPQPPVGTLADCALPYLWLIAFFLLPFLIVLKVGLSRTTAIAQPLHAGARSRGGMEGT